MLRYFVRLRGLNSHRCLNYSNATIAARLQLPDTHFLLDYIRPDILGLLVISRSLVLWDDIEPTTNWIDFQIPPVVKNSINIMKDGAKRVMNMGNLSGTGLAFKQDDADCDNIAKKQIADFDPHAMRQANANIIAGACFALGLKYAGSANRAAATAIFERTLWFFELRDNKDVGVRVQRPDNSTLITCLCTAAISLAMVMAGTGDLDSFRLIRSLRWKCDDSTLYGAHMAFGAAIGLLFLGGGKCTLGSSPEDVAVLIAAFYPHFPILSSDNQYHLQALRHLYVLASHERILEAFDVDRNEKVCIPIELSIANSNDTALASTPFLVANESSFAQLRSNSDRYYPIVVNATEWNTRSNLPTLFVKRKPGHLSHLQDPSGLLSLSMQQVESTSFTKYFCFSSFDDDKLFESFCSEIAYECTREGKSSDVLAMILRVYRLLESYGNTRVGIENIWDAKLIKTFSTTSAFSLINRELLSLLRERVDDSFRSYRTTWTSAVNNHAEKWWERDCQDFGAFLIWTGVPLKCSVNP